MTKRILIVGSGPAAAAAALACSSQSDLQVTMLDIGARLEPDRERTREHLASARPKDWDAADLAAISEPPVSSRVKGPPQKRTFGSDYPFRDVGQLAGVIGSYGANDAVVSGAFGGFSNVWGAQVMPFPESTLREWPIAVEEMHRHYAQILAQIPYAAEDDDLAESFPLLAPATALPAPSERTTAVLRRYEKHRASVNRRRIVVGRARLAFDAEACIRCGLCMTGCPHQLIYSAAQTIDRLRRSGALTYLPGLLAVRVEEGANSATVVAKELRSGYLRRFVADRVFLACGGIGTARLVAGSLRLEGREIQLQESSQFLLPFLSLAPSRHDPRTCSDFTLNQFNMAVGLDDGHADVAHLHFYTYNPAFDDQFPLFLRTRAGALAHVLRRVSVAFGYLPAWASSQQPRLRIGKIEDPDDLPPLAVVGEQISGLRNHTLRYVVRRILAAAPALDLWPLLPLLRLSAPAKSYHFGSAFPHAAGDPDMSSLRSDLLGRVGPWRRIHAIDGSTLPSVAATTFTLTVMANAHRIVETSLTAPLS